MFESSNASDLLRCNQKDEYIIEELRHHLSNVLRLWGNRNFNKLRTFVPSLSLSTYYLLTSLSNLQTLGEEYTGLLRFIKSQKNIPSKWVQIVWMVLYIGGDDIFVKFINSCKHQLHKNENLTEHSKTTLIKILRILQDVKIYVTRFHQVIFFMNGKYYHISNRITQIEYVFLRKWMKDDQSIEAFKLLGRISLFYLLVSVLHKLYYNFQQKLTTNNLKKCEAEYIHTTECFLCMKNKVNPTTLMCGHVFCWYCINDIITYDPMCPICRERIQPSRIVMLQNY